MAGCIFCSIAEKTIPSTVVYESKKVFAIRDINPQAPEHIVIFPKQHLDGMNSVTDLSLYADIFEAIAKIAENLNIRENGYRVVVNSGRDGGQTVSHIHFHLLGGRAMHWPPG